MSTKELSPWGSALAGAMAAVFANAAIYPLDTVKTRIQAADGQASEQEDEVDHVREDGEAPAPPARKRLTSDGMLTGLARILKEEGLSGYYKGFLANMINCFSMQWAYFYAYSLIRSLYLDRQRRRFKGKGSPPALSTAVELLLGALAGALAQVFTIPVAVIATRQQLSKPEDGDAQSLLEVARQIIAEDGPTGLWRGLRPGLVLTVNPALTYGLSSRFKEVILRRQGTSKLSSVQSFALGAFSKSIATVVTYPYIMAKVRLQARRFPSALPESENLSSSSTLAPKPGEEVESSFTYADAARKSSETVVSSFSDVTVVPPRKKERKADANTAIGVLTGVYQEKGFTGLYQGMGAQIFKAVLTQGILFTVKDHFEQYAYILLLIFSSSSSKKKAEAVVHHLKDDIESRARLVGRQLPSAKHSLAFAERAAQTVGKDVVEKLAVEAVVGAIKS